MLQSAFIMISNYTDPTTTIVTSYTVMGSSLVFKLTSTEDDSLTWSKTDNILLQKNSVFLIHFRHPARSTQY